MKIALILSSNGLIQRVTLILNCVLPIVFLNPAYAATCYTSAPLMDVDGNPRPIEPVCKALLKNLNQFCDQPPMACALKISPQFKHVFALPKWEAMDPQANRALIKDFLWAPYTIPRNNQNDALDKQIRDEQLAGINAAFSAKRIRFYKSQLDLYNLGKKQIAYRLDYGDCKLKNPQLKRSSNHWDEAISSSFVKTQQAPDVVRKLFRQYQPIGFGPLYEAFIYKNTTYSFVMQGRDDPYYQNEMLVNRGERWVNPSSQKVFLHDANVCLFKYDFTQGANK